LWIFLFVVVAPGIDQSRLDAQICSTANYRGNFGVRRHFDRSFCLWRQQAGNPGAEQDCAHSLSGGDPESGKTYKFTAD
jgi:hypothetical protein